MRNPWSRLAAGSLSLALVLVSVQAAVPAAAQVVAAGAFEGAARGTSISAASMGNAPLGMPGTALTLSPAASLGAPSVFASAPIASPAALASGLAAASAVTRAPEGTVRASEGTVRAPEGIARAAEGVSRAPEGTSRAPEGVASTPLRAKAAAARPDALPRPSDIDGARFDGARALSSLAAASAPSEGAINPPAAAAPAAPRWSLVSRFIVRPLRAAASPAVSAWSKTRASVATISENGTWVSGFWRSLKADGVNVSKELKTASAMALVIAAVSLVPSWLYGQLAQHLRDLQTLGSTAGTAWYHVPVLQTFGALSLALVVAHSLSALLTKYQSKTMFTLGNKLMKGVSDLYVAKVLSLDMRWQNSRNVGDVVSTATDAIYTLQSTASAMIVDLVRNGAVALIAGAVMVAVSWKLSLFAIPFLILVLSIPSSVYSKRVQDAYRSFFSMKKPKFASALQEIVVNILKVKSAGLEQRELEKMRAFSHETYMVGGGEIAAVSAPQRALAGGLTDVAKVLVMAAAVWAVYMHVLPVSVAVTYIFLSNFFREAMQALTGLWVSLKSMRGAAARYDKTMKQASEDLHLDGKTLAPAANGRRIEMRDVKFRYTNDGAPVLKGIDLDIKPGEMVGFVGMSGGGKTTAAMTLLGLYPLEAGKVLVDGVPMDELNLRAFRGEVGVSLQDSIPFAGTLSDNISYLRPGATEGEIWDAARASGLHDQVVRFGADRALASEGVDDKDSVALMSALSERLPALREALRKILPADAAAQVPTAALDKKKGLLDNVVGGSGASWEQFLSAAQKAGVLDDVARLGYRTRVGERGINISGGQKQRLMLAQIFIQPQKPFGVMIYDEPTAALDGRTQQLIEDQIAQRRGKTTQIVIAHRLSNVQRADRIVVFSEGAIVEQGTHDELMKSGGVYAKMWDAQRLLDAASQNPAKAR
jgi:ABC-type multidrug transport system fused ATPase/permease subunit